MISTDDCKQAILDWVAKNRGKVHYNKDIDDTTLSRIKRIFKRKINGVETRLYEVIGGVFIIKVADDEIKSIELLTRKMYFDKYEGIIEVKNSWGWLIEKYQKETMWAGKIMAVNDTPEWDIEGTAIV